VLTHDLISLALMKPVRDDDRRTITTSSWLVAHPGKGKSLFLEICFLDGRKCSPGPDCSPTSDKQCTSNDREQNRVLIRVVKKNSPQNGNTTSL
jgi:hypothetical protein